MDEGILELGSYSLQLILETALLLCANQLDVGQFTDRRFIFGLLIFVQEKTKLIIVLLFSLLNW